MMNELQILRRPDWRWLMFFAGLMIAWTALFAMWVGGRVSDYSSIYGAEFWLTICAASATGAGFTPIFGMWVLMSAAMMTPTIIPALRTYDGLTQTEAANGTGFAALITGYLSIWIGFSALAAVVQISLADAILIAPDGSSQSVSLTIGLLLVAGLYQFSSVKSACLARCRMPMTFFMQYWKPGASAAFSMGARLGIVCLGCCWALMALAFVGGTNSLVWMGVATLLMIFEKLPDVGIWVTKPLGWALLLAAAVIGGVGVLG